MNDTDRFRPEDLLAALTAEEMRCLIDDMGPDRPWTTSSGTLLL